MNNNSNNNNIPPTTDRPKEQSYARIRRLKVVLSLSSTYFAAAIITVQLTGSLSLLSEAGHMLADIGGIGLSLFAVGYSRKLPTPNRTFGFYRMEILASLVNSLGLVLLSAYILYEGFKRLVEPPEIPGFPIIVVGSIGLAVNFIIMRLQSSSSSNNHSLHSHSHHDHSELLIDRDGEYNNTKNNRNEREECLNIKAVYLETLSDTLGAAGVIVTGILVLVYKFYLADPIVSIRLAVFMLTRTWTITIIIHNMRDLN
jgi:cobalt-zinc-cadmium efflux system protein